MRGHGTYAHSNQLVSCGAGRIERVNKLASVRPVTRGTRAPWAVGRRRDRRGRAPELEGRCWFDAQGHASHHVRHTPRRRAARADARRHARDEELFKEGDVVVCEVQAVNADGQLHCT